MIRSHDAGSLRADHIGEQVTLAGWVARRRDHGGVAFIDLRQASGVVQVVVREDVAHLLRAEYCLKVVGTVQRRRTLDHVLTVLGGREPAGLEPPVRDTLRLGAYQLLYTDGVTETPGDGERFGERRLRAAVDAAPPEADALLRAVAAELDGFERGTSLDDRAMLALRRQPSSASRT